MQPATYHMQFSFDSKKIENKKNPFVPCKSIMPLQRYEWIFSAEGSNNIMIDDDDDLLACIRFNIYFHSKPMSVSMSE